MLLGVFPDRLNKLLLVLVRHIPTSLGMALRYMLVSRLSRTCGRCVAIREGVYLLGVENMEFGDHVSVHPMSYLDGTGGIAIGSNVSIAHSTTILSTEHDFSQPNIPTRDAPVRCRAVAIGDDVWLGCAVRVLAGVHVGEGAVVGAGAVVTKSLSPRTVSAGVPAKTIRWQTKPGSSSSSEVEGSAIGFGLTG